MTNYTLERGTAYGTYGTHTSEGASTFETVVTGLAQNTTYFFIVYAGTAAGYAAVASNVAPAHTLSNTPGVVIPPVLTASGATGTTAIASWSSARNVSGTYSLYFGATYGTWHTFATGLSSPTEDVVTGLSPNTTYFVQVDVGVNASQSNIAVAHTLPNTPYVVVPPVLTASGVTGTSVVASWSSAQNATGSYSLYWGTAYGTWHTFATGLSSPGEDLVTGLAQNTTYFVQVDVGANVTASNIAVAHTPSNLPPPERDVLAPVLTATGISVSAVAVSWGAAENVTVANYTLAYGTTFGAYTTHVSGGASTFETTVAGLARNSTYWFVVYAGTAANYTAVASNAVPARTMAATTPGPLFPVATAAAVNTTGITVSWRAPPGTVTNYTLMYARFYGLPIAYVSVGNKTVYNLTNLGFGLTYYVTVWAWNGTAEGLPSNVAVAQTDVPIPAQTPFPWSTLTAVTMLSILGSLAVSAAIAVFVAGRRGRRAEGAAAVALARSRPRPGEINEPPNRDRRRP